MPSRRSTLSLFFRLFSPLSSHLIHLSHAPPSSALLVARWFFPLSPSGFFCHFLPFPVVHNKQRKLPSWLLKSLILVSSSVFVILPFCFLYRFLFCSILLALFFLPRNFLPFPLSPLWEKQNPVCKCKWVKILLPSLGSSRRRRISSKKREWSSFLFIFFCLKYKVLKILHFLNYFFINKILIFVSNSFLIKKSLYFFL